MGKVPWLWLLGGVVLGAVVAPKVIALTGGRLPQVGR